MRPLVLLCVLISSILRELAEIHVIIGWRLTFGVGAPHEIQRSWIENSETVCGHLNAVKFRH